MLTPAMASLSRRVALTTVGLALLTAASASSADAQSIAADRFRLSVDQSFFDFRSVDVEGAPEAEKYRSFGLLGRGFGLAFGASFGDLVFVGSRLRLEWSKDATDQTALSWGLEPFAELMFLEGPAIPFVTAGLGVSGEVITPDGADSIRATFLGFRFGGGAHLFLTDSFSIDPRLEIGWNTRVGEGELEPNYTVLRFGIVVGLSGWFGGGTERVAPRESAASEGLDAPPNATTETLDFGGGVRATLYGTPGQPAMTIRFERRGPTPVLNGCSSLVWQIDGQAAEMPVAYAQSIDAESVEREGMLEVLEGRTASHNAALLGNARVVTLTVCGASFTLTPRQLQQLGAFSRRLQQGTPARSDPWDASPRAY